jgi:hypothetical protein
VAVALIVCSLLRFFVGQMFIIASPSMESTNDVLTGPDYLVETDITVRSSVGTAGVLGRSAIVGQLLAGRPDEIASTAVRPRQL